MYSQSTVKSIRSRGFAGVRPEVIVAIRLGEA
jgi:hypothetical protein